MAAGKLLETYEPSYPQLRDALCQCAAQVEAKAPKNPEALCLALQEAHWFYLDEIVEAAKGHYPHLQPPTFVDLLLEVSQALTSHGSEISRCFRDWCQQRLAQPRCGAVIMDEAIWPLVLPQRQARGWRERGAVRHPGGLGRDRLRHHGASGRQAVPEGLRA
ncbi:DCP2 [Symbiodinium natans]|uniref:DCP2 protein n=1 Tax=Symbiodinium natans TaxID=878477 RepID=A0A812UTM8_9DINO|nr:DCP2 [Symbiodinium natans]